MFDDNASAQLVAIANMMNVKDSRWLQLEVCREFQRGQCSRSETECKFSHPPSHVEIQNGRVTACYDSIKGRCTRENPKCKYLHPPQHLKDQLLINGRNNLALKNLLMNQLTTPAVTAPLGVSPLTLAGSMVPSVATTYNPFAAYAINPTAGAAVYPGLVASPDFYNSMNSVLQTGAMTSQASVAAAMALQAQKAAAVASATTTAAGTSSSRSDKTEQALNSSASKRAAIDKSGIPFYQPVAHMPTVSLGLQYPQLTGTAGSTMATLYPSYFPAFAPNPSALMATHSVTSPAMAANLLFGGLTNQQTALHNASVLLDGNKQPLPNPTVMPTNAYAVAYFDESGQLLDTLPVCRDFKQGRCNRSGCRYVHLTDDYVHVSEGKVTVCRDFAKGKCSRSPCKFYHVPLPPSNSSPPSNEQQRPPSAPPLVRLASHSSLGAQPTNQIAVIQQQHQSLILAPPTSSSIGHALSAALQQQQSALLAPPLSSYSSLGHALFALQQQQQANQLAAHYAAVQSANAAAMLTNRYVTSFDDRGGQQMALVSPASSLDYWSNAAHALLAQQQMHLSNDNRETSSIGTCSGL